MTRGAADRIAVVIGVVTVASGAVQLLVPGRVLGALGLTASGPVVMLFRLASLLVGLIGAAQLRAVLAGDGARAALTLAGTAKLGGVAILAWYAGRLELTAVARVSAGYDGLAGLFLLWLGVRGGR